MHWHVHAKTGALKQLNMEREFFASNFTNTFRPHYFRSLRYLTLGFAHFSLVAEDKDPDCFEILEKAIGNQLHKLTLIGLNSKPDLAAKLEKALVAHGFH